MFSAALAWQCEPRYDCKMAEATYLVFDLETVADPALVAASSASSAAQSPPGGQQSPPEGQMAPLPAHRIITLGILWLDEDYRLLRLATLGHGDDELQCLREFVDLVARQRPQLVTFAGRTFDLPLLLLRALHHGLSVPWFFEAGNDGTAPQYRDRHGRPGHLDLRDAFGPIRQLSLRSAARLIGLPGKLDVDGSQVEALYHAGKIEQIERYCLMDVVQTALLLLRLRRLQGELTRERYRALTEMLLQDLEPDPRMQQLLAAVDRDRLLLL